MKDRNIDENNRFLGEIFGEEDYREIFLSKKLIILNKGICGNGGTSGMIEYALNNAKGLLVLCPNVSIVQSKEKQYADDDRVACLWGKKKASDVNLDTLVIISTYDKLNSLRKHIEAYGFGYTEKEKEKRNWYDGKFWIGRTIVVDEYHMIATDSRYRDIMFDVIELAINYQQSCLMMSATPFKEFTDALKKHIEKGDIDKTVEECNINYPLFDNHIRIVDATKAKKPMRSLTTLLKKVKKGHDADVKKNGHILVFWNSPEEINDAVGHIGSSDDIEVLCSVASKSVVGDYFSDDFNPKKKMHFITSRGFTGWDCNETVDVIYIIGGSSHSTKCYSGRDIKQMIGRARNGCDNILVVHLGGMPTDLNGMVTEVKEQIDVYKHKNYWEGRDLWMNYYQYVIGEQDKVKCCKMWKNIDILAYCIKHTGYKNVRIVDIKKCITEEEYGKLRKKRDNITFKELKKKILNGEDVSNKDSRYAGMLKLHYEIMGHCNVSYRELESWYKIYKSTKDIDKDKFDLIDDIDKRRRYVGLYEFTIYSGGVLKSMCEKILGHSIEIGELTKYMVSQFKVFPIPLSNVSVFGSYSTFRHNSYILVFNSELINEIYEFFAKTAGKKTVHYIYNKDKKLSFSYGNFLQGDIEQEYSSKVSLTTAVKNGQTMAKTVSLTDLSSSILPSIREIPDAAGFIEAYDIAISKGVSRKDLLPSMKADSQWGEVYSKAKTSQNKMSELFADTDKEYRQIKENTHYIECLMCDIDNSVPFSQFKSEFSQFRWIAYPTFSNYEEDWTNFRVIFPLRRRIYIKGDNNVKVVKLLRHLLCKYVDLNHNLPSFINRDAWQQRIDNQGETLEIPQHLVDRLMFYVQVTLVIAESFGYLTTEERIELANNVRNFKSLTMEESKKMFDYAVAHSEIDNLRYNTLFPIKNGLPTDQWDDFKRYLGGINRKYIDYFDRTTYYGHLK